MTAHNRPGDGLLDLAVFVWVTVMVGPWWVGAGLYALAWAMNLWAQQRRPPRPR